MKKIKISLEDLIIVLEALKETGTENVVFFEYNDLPAMADAAEPENIILFQSTGGEETTDGEGAIH